ncbi:hypothetical protein SAMN02910355_1131 [Terrisporobacter glycolicus]|nr:hypothetical protein SAMN02910355_1131 [Terrisporobacter glycolicus]
MFTELSNMILYMIGRIFNNLDIFISSIFFILVFGYILYFLVRRVHKLITKSETRDAKLDILLVPFIIFFMLLAVIIVISGQENNTITEANILVAIVSFISPFIAFTGAYALSDINHNKSEKIRIKNENNEKVKKYSQEQNQLEHKKICYIIC